MSTFTVPGVKIRNVRPAPNSDSLDLVDVLGYQCIVQKGRYQDGDVAIYVPEGGVVPEAILKQAGFWNDEQGKGMLAGSKGDRVKAIKLRGNLSQGILLNPTAVLGAFTADEDMDYAEKLGIVKYEVPIPAHLAGDVFDAGLGGFSYTDIENIKKFPGVLSEGQNVVMTEKLHGTCAIFYLQYDETLSEPNFYVSSKGMASKGLALTENDHNFYWRIAKKYDLEKKLMNALVDWMSAVYTSEFDRDLPTGIALFAEGLGVQDLKYGVAGSDAEARFFDMRVHYDNGEVHYMPWGTTQVFLDKNELPPVPTVYIGPFGEGILEEHTRGKSTLADHVREGVVVQPQVPEEADGLGRVILKSISEDYLLRKGEATEFE